MKSADSGRVSGRTNLPPTLQEPTPVAPLQPSCLVNEVCTESMDELIQRTARPEPPPVLPQREQPRLHASWAGKSRFVRPLAFSRPPFPTSLTHTLNEWGTTAPPQAMRPGNWPQQWEAAKQAHALSQMRGDLQHQAGQGSDRQHQHCRRINRGMRRATSDRCQSTRGKNRLL